MGDDEDEERIIKPHPKPESKSILRDSVNVDNTDSNDDDDDDKSSEIDKEQMFKPHHKRVPIWSPPMKKKHRRISTN
jgi:hypothetical protein